MLRAGYAIRKRKLLNMPFSQIPPLDSEIERILREECKRHKVNTSIPEEVGSRLTQTKYPNGNMEWKIDKKLIMRLTIIHKPTKTVFELQRIASNIILLGSEIQLAEN